MKKKIILSLLLTVCLSGLVHLPGMEPSRLRCEGAYPQHLQGFDGSKDALFWSFTVTLVKTDLTGKKLLELPVRNHHGDLCVHDNKVYVIANYGKFNNPAGLADNHVMIYDTASLKLIKSIPLPEVKHGGGAIARTNNGFMITGGLPGDEQKFPGNILYEYDNDFKFIKQ